MHTLELFGKNGTPYKTLVVDTGYDHGDFTKCIRKARRLNKKYGLLARVYDEDYKLVFEIDELTDFSTF